MHISVDLGSVQDVDGDGEVVRQEFHFQVFKKIVIDFRKLTH